MTATSQVHDRLATLADPTRGRILLALDQHELTVGELCAVLSLPQSTVSRHLKVLADEAWLATRQEGTSRFYSRAKDQDPGAQRLWAVVAEDLKAGGDHRRDLKRLDDVIAQRRSKSREFFAGSAGSWEELRAELVGGAVGGGALLGLLEPDWVVGDLGCGSGHLTALLAPFVRQVIGIDASEHMLDQARARLAGQPGAELRIGELESLPLNANELDAAVLSLVMHHTPEPKRVLEEVFRVLKANGRLLVIDLLPHDRVEYQERMGHVWLGFSTNQMSEWLEGIGFSHVRVIELPAESAAGATGLFVATGSRRQKTGNRE